MKRPLAIVKPHKYTSSIFFYLPGLLPSKTFCFEPHAVEVLARDDRLLK